MRSWMFTVTTCIVFAGDRDPQEILVQLQGQGSANYEAWILVLDNEEPFPFSAEGAVSVIKPPGSVHFEVLDALRGVRYLGLWEQFGDSTEITIQVDHPGLFLKQVVSGSRTVQRVWAVPGEVGVVSPEEQPERSAPQTSDWLKERAGVLLQKTNLGGGSPIMRGMSGNRILLLVDGFRLNNAIYRLGLNQYLNTLPESHLSQSEVLGGPSGVQYGSDGLGGTIHLRSLDPATLSPAGAGYRGFVSSADGTQYHRLSGHRKLGDTALLGHFQWNDYQDLKAADPVGEQVPTGFESWDSSFNLSHDFNENRRLRLLNTYSSATHVPRTDRVQSGQDLVWEYHPQRLRFHGLRFEESMSARFTDHLDLGLGYFRQDEGIRRLSSGSPDRLLVETTQVNTLQANGTFTKLTPGIQWIYGFDYQQDEVDSAGSSRTLSTGENFVEPGKFPADAAFDSMGLFLVSRFELPADQKLNAGVRQTWANLTGTLTDPIGAIDETYRQLTPSLTWSLDRPRYFVSFGISQGFRAPNLEDALALGPSNRGFDAPNPDLEPERLWNYEVNLRMRPFRGTFQVSLFTARYDDLIERVPGSYRGSDTYEGESVFILDNVGQARVDGANLHYERPSGSHHRFTADGSWTYGTQTDRNEPMTRIAPLRGNFGWAYQADRLQLSGVFSWAGRQDRLSPQDILDSRIPEGGTPSYGVVHLRGRYRIRDRVYVNLGLENLGDKLYKQHGSGIYEPGRRAVVALEARWQ